MSSSGHLVVGQHLLGVSAPGAVFEVCVHLGTLLAVLAFYRREVAGMVLSLARRRRAPLTRLALLLALGTVPAGAAGVLLGDRIEALFERPEAVVACLAFTGTVLLATRLAVPRGARVGVRETLLVGTAQAVALLPGVSRSGMTISAGLFLGLSGHRAARFAFLLSLPAVAGATLLKARDIGALSSAEALRCGAGAAAAFATGLLALRLMVFVAGRRRLHWFGVYCLAAALALVAL